MPTPKETTPKAGGKRGILVLMGLVLAAVLVTVVFVVANVLVPRSGPNPSACVGVGCSSPQGFIVPAGGYVLVSEVRGNPNYVAGSNVNMTIGLSASSNSQYYLYLMNQSAYAALGWTSNASSPSHATTSGPASSYTWSSGKTTSASYRSKVPNVDWFVIVYNPGTVPSSVDVSVSVSIS